MAVATSPTTPAIAPPRPDAFLSYSRRDKAFVEGRLAAALEARGKDVWLDVDDIRGGASDWRARVWTGIEASKAVVFVLSPDSLASHVCGEELAHATSLNKRLIPLLHRSVDGLPVPEALSRPNWILARDEDPFETSVATLLDALETDEPWLDAHARLTERTAEWLRADRDRSFLLRGSDLRAAERWLDAQGGHAETPTPDQVAYIHAGRRAAARRQRLVLGGVVLALAVSVALGVVAYVQRQSARSQAFAARAIDVARRDPEAGLRLALRAAALGHGPLAARALRETVGAAGWTWILRGDPPRPLNDVAFAPGGRLAASAGEDGRARVWDLRTGRLVATLRHGGPVNTVAFSPDGARVLTAAGDGTARLWSTAGRLARTLRPGGREVWSAAFDPRGRRVLTATGGGAAQVWDLAGGAPVRLPRARGADHLAEATFSPDGRRILTAGPDGAVRRFSLGRRPRAVVLRSPPGAIAVVATFSPDGRRVLTGTSDGTACLWTGPRRPRCHRRPARGAAADTITDASFSRDGSAFVTASDDGTAVVRAVAGDRRLATLRVAGALTAAALSPDGARVATAGVDRRVRVWTADGVLERVLGGHTDAVVGVRFSPDGRRLMTASDDGSARVWDVFRGARILPGAPLPDAGVAFSPDGRRLLAANAAGRAVVWDLGRRTRTALEPGFAPVDPLDLLCGRATGCSPWSPDGSRIAGADAAGQAAVWDARTGRERRLGVRDAFGAAFSPDGRRLAIVGALGPLVLRGLRDRSTVAVRGARDVENLQFSADGSRFMTGTLRNSAEVYTAAGRRLGPRRSIGPPQAAAIDPAGARVAVGTGDGRVRVAPAAGGPGRATRATGSDVAAVAFSPSGRQVAAVGADWTARIWERTGLGAPVAVLRGHTQPVTSVAFSPDGRFLLTASADGTARLWDPQLETTVIELPMSPSGGVAFSPDGRSLAVGGTDTVRVQACELCGSFAALRRAARARLPRR